MKKDKDKEYVLMTLDDFVKLRERTIYQQSVEIKQERLLFLASVIKELHLSQCVITFEGNNVKLKGWSPSRTVESSFDINLCDLYFNQTSRFISHVI